MRVRSMSNANYSDMSDKLRMELNQDFKDWFDTIVYPNITIDGDLLRAAFIAGANAIGCYCTDYHVCGFCDM